MQLPVWRPVRRRGHPASWRYGQPHTRLGFAAVRAVVIAKHGGLDVLEVQERPEPSPGPGQVRIDVRAAGVNFADTLARVGLYADAPKPPCVVGYEVAGTIAAVGDGVDAGASASASWPGRPSAATPRRSWSRRPMRWRCPSACPSRRAPRCRSSTPRRGRRCTASARCARASASSSTPPPAVSASPRCSWPSAAGPRSTARRRRASTTGCASSASTAPSTTAATAGGATCPATTSSSTASAAPRSSAPTRCCAPAGASSPSAPRRSRRARRATCAARCRRPCG